MTGENPKMRLLCLKHGRSCSMPSAQSLLHLAGFTCKGNSTQNTKHRWSKETGPLSTDDPSLSCFQMVLSTLRRTKPRYVVLENVVGSTLRACTRNDWQ